MTYLFLFSLNYSFASSFDDISLNSSESKAYELILSLKFEAAAELIQSKRPSSIYLRSLSESLQLVVSEDKKLYQDFEGHHDERISELKSSKQQDANIGFFLAEMNIHSAFVNLKFGHEFKAAWQLKRAYKIIGQNLKKFPKFLPNQKTSGLMQVLIGSVPKKYQWIASLFGLEGSVESGLLELDNLVVTDNHYQQETRIIQSLIYSYLLGQPDKGLEVYGALYDQNDENEFLAYLNILLLMKTQQSYKADSIFSGFYPDNIQTSIMYYVGGEIYLQQGDFSKSKILYEYFINKHKGVSNLKDARYKIFLCSYLSGDTDAPELRQRASEYDKNNTEADRYATSILDQRENPDPLILKIRLLTDGGYFEKAEALVTQNKDRVFLNSKNKAEYEYRKARLAHSQQQLNKAIKHYKNTIALSDNQSWYFAPNSCLKLGDIYADQEKKIDAKDYYKLIFEYKDYQYKRSIENKARIALKALD